MRNVYRGIDLAGDQSRTGLADLVEVGGRLYARVFESGYGGDPQLNGLLRVQPGETIAGCAIDQPLGMPACTLRLLSPESYAGNPLPQYFSLWSRFRRADSAMRHALKNGGGVNPDYVLPPVACDNIWRALYLLKAAEQDIVEVRLGRSVWCETHPRLCVAGLVPRGRGELVEKYKYTKTIRGLKEEREETRRWHKICKWYARGTCLDLLSSRLPSLVIDRGNRDRLLDDHNAFEALFCAVTAYAKARERVKRFPEDDVPEADAMLEGYVFVPDWASLNS
jgi:hypothetical protein